MVLKRPSAVHFSFKNIFEYLNIFKWVSGYFDQQSRQNLFTAWKHHLDMAAIAYRSDMARTEFLSDPDQRIQWQSNKLPTDDLCTENAIMLSRFNRYPLIIDPSGQASIQKSNK